MPNVPLMMTATVVSSLKEQPNSSQFSVFVSHDPSEAHVVGFVSAESERTAQPGKIKLCHNNIWTEMSRCPQSVEWVTAEVHSEGPKYPFLSKIENLPHFQKWSGFMSFYYFSFLSITCQVNLLTEGALPRGMISYIVPRRVGERKEFEGKILWKWL